ncbi:kynureninase [Alteribacter natronophilus]|uniref:kynureninase n=1 Tax=Alteribacter natronophilus TaxID=2583810 RepID=UPI00110D5A72|nr:kynureninase [Alteribacter natronophilus]TMW70699.1 kynureninase [Alteribacter natronophilus]
MAMTEQQAIERDRQDPLGHFKSEFYLKENTVYLNGNSLGLLSRRAEQTLLTSLNDWKEQGIDGWMNGEEPWFYLSEKLGKKSAPLIGAKPEEVIVTGSITVNIHQLVSSFYKPEGKRTKILADAVTFPSDIYALKSMLTLKGFDPAEHLLQAGNPEDHVLDEEELIEAMTEDVALILLPSVLYRSGQVLDMKRLTEEAHSRGIVIGFDLAHSIGALPHELHAWGVDFAMWCNYKYMNNGPGGTGGLFVHEKHFGTSPGLAGWFGSDKDKQFDMEHEFTPAADAGAFQIGTPHVLSSAPLLGSLELFEEAGIDAVRKKSLALTEFFMELADEKLDGLGFTVINPREADKRGGHICLQHTHSASICKALKAGGIVPDFRAPDMIRLAPVALYTGFHDVWRTVDTLARIVKNEEYRAYTNKRNVIA